MSDLGKIMVDIGKIMVLWWWYNSELLEDLGEIMVLWWWHNSEVQVDLGEIMVMWWWYNSEVLVDLGEIMVLWWWYNSEVLVDLPTDPSSFSILVYASIILTWGLHVWSNKVQSYYMSWDYLHFVALRCKSCLLYCMQRSEVCMYMTLRGSLLRPWSMHREN